MGLVWIGMFLLGAGAAYRHLRSLERLVTDVFAPHGLADAPDAARSAGIADPSVGTRPVGAPTSFSPEAQRRFRLRWWMRQIGFLAILAAAALLLRRAALPFLLGVVVFEILGKKILLRRYQKGANRA